MVNLPAPSVTTQPAELPPVAEPVVNVFAPNVNLPLFEKVILPTVEEALSVTDWLLMVTSAVAIGATPQDHVEPVEKPVEAMAFQVLVTVIVGVPLKPVETQPLASVTEVNEYICVDKGDTEKSAPLVILLAVTGLVTNEYGPVPPVTVTLRLPD